MLQKQEKERLRRAKERARMKQLQKQMEENHTNHTTIANHSAFHNNQRHSSSDNSPPMQRQSRNGSHYSADADSIMYEEISPLLPSEYRHLFGSNVQTQLDSCTAAEPAAQSVAEAGRVEC